MIHIDYALLRKAPVKELRITDDLLRKAKGTFGFRARKQLMRLFDSQIRLLAAEVARRETDPVLLYEAGAEGVRNALEVYSVDEEQGTFEAFAKPFIRQHMLRAKTTVPVSLRAQS